MPNCALKSCDSRYAKWAGPDFSLFTFPVNNETREKWTRFVQLDEDQEKWVPTATARLCSLHFRKKDIVRGKSGRKLLKRGSVPCIRDSDEMQQQMSQPEPIGGQQPLSQQMVLCPVRFVYETQVLVQPGEQIQPNQTFFINPQNPPPWMQNRQQPNPVVYVQQLPNNIVPSVQPHMDQNQLYLQQNYANFQLQQHMLAQNHQEIRPTMQLANIVPNMVQNVQQNMSTDRNVQTANPGQMQANTQNMIQNQINIANTRQVTTQPMNQTVEVQRPVFMNMRPQIAHQVNIARPVMSINQIQNMQQLANMQNVQIQHANVGQTIFQSVGQRPPSLQNVNTVRPQTPANTIVNIQPVAKVREIAPDVKQTISTAVGPAVPVRNFSQNYNCRQIQPKRRYVQNTAANTTMTKIQSQHIPVQPIPTGYNSDKSNTHQNVTTVATNTNHLNNPNMNRKRKSESPDEVQKKMAVQSAVKPNYNPQQSLVVTKLCNEIGTNTSPVHKPYVNTNNAAIQINPNTPVLLVENIQLLNENILKNTEQNITVSPIQSEKDKLIRNTVYTQARGRVLQDKISEIVKPQVENPIEIVPINTAVNIPSFEMQTDTIVTDEVNAKAAKQTEIQTEEAAVIEPENVNINLEQETKSEIISKPQTVERTINTPDITITIRVLPEETNVTEEVSKKEDAQPEVDKKVVSNKDKDFILTHVVDGYVIQESNFAFPIRKPLKEKTLFTNSKAEDSESTDALKECMREEMKSNAVDIPLLPFHYLLLNCDKKEEEEKAKEEKAKEEKTKEEKAKEDKTKEEMSIEEKTQEEDDSMKNNPFETLQQTTVKAWTVEDLSQHLLKYDWKDTVSVFQDHEIDGESLFLVSKTQLMNIGVAEEHTDVICESNKDRPIKKRSYYNRTLYNRFAYKWNLKPHTGQQSSTSGLQTQSQNTLHLEYVPNVETIEVNVGQTSTPNIGQQVRNETTVGLETVDEANDQFITGIVENRDNNNFHTIVKDILKRHITSKNSVDKRNDNVTQRTTNYIPTLKAENPNTPARTMSTEEKSAKKDRKRKNVTSPTNNIQKKKIIMYKVDKKSNDSQDVVKYVPKLETTASSICVLYVDKVEKVDILDYEQQNKDKIPVNLIKNKTAAKPHTTDIETSNECTGEGVENREAISHSINMQPVVKDITRTPKSRAKNPDKQSKDVPLNIRNEIPMLETANFSTQAQTISTEEKSARKDRKIEKVTSTSTNNIKRKSEKKANKVNENSNDSQRVVPSSDGPKLKTNVPSIRDVDKIKGVTRTNTYKEVVDKAKQHKDIIPEIKMKNNPTLITETSNTTHKTISTEKKSNDKDKIRNTNAPCISYKKKRMDDFQEMINKYRAETCYDIPKLRTTEIIIRKNMDKDKVSLDRTMNTNKEKVEILENIKENREKRSDINSTDKSNKQEGKPVAQSTSRNISTTDKFKTILIKEKSDDKDRKRNIDTSSTKYIKMNKETRADKCQEMSNKSRSVSCPGDPNPKSTVTICNKIDKDKVSLDRTMNTTTEKVEIQKDRDMPKINSTDKSNKQEREAVTQSSSRNKPPLTTDNSNKTLNTISTKKKSDDKDRKRNIDTSSTKHVKRNKEKPADNGQEMSNKSRASLYLGDPKLKRTEIICNKIDKNTVTIDRTTNTATEKVKIPDNVQGNKEESPVMKRADKSNKRDREDLPQSSSSNMTPTLTIDNTKTISTKEKSDDKDRKRNIDTSSSRHYKRNKEKRASYPSDPKLKTTDTIISNKMDKDKVSLDRTTNTATEKVKILDNVQGNKEESLVMKHADKSNKRDREDLPQSCSSNMTPTLTIDNTKTIPTKEKSDDKDRKRNIDTSSTEHIKRNKETRADKCQEMSNKSRSVSCPGDPNPKPTVTICNKMDKDKVPIDRTINTNIEKEILENVQGNREEMLEMKSTDKSNKREGEAVAQSTSRNKPRLTTDNSNKTSKEKSDDKDKKRNIDTSSSRHYKRNKEKRAVNGQEMSNKSRAESCYEQPKFKATLYISNIMEKEMDKDEVTIDRTINTNIEKVEILDNVQEIREKMPAINSTDKSNKREGEAVAQSTSRNKPRLTTDNSNKAIKEKSDDKDRKRNIDTSSSRHYKRNKEKRSDNGQEMSNKSRAESSYDQPKFKATVYISNIMEKEMDKDEVTIDRTINTNVEKVEILENVQESREEMPEMNSTDKSNKREGEAVAQSTSRNKPRLTTDNSNKTIKEKSDDKDRKRNIDTSSSRHYKRNKEKRADKDQEMSNKSRASLYLGDPKLKTTETIISNKMDKDKVSLDRTMNTATEKVKIPDKVQGNKEESPVMKRADKSNRRDREDLPQSSSSNMTPTLTIDNTKTIPTKEKSDDKDKKRNIDTSSSKHYKRNKEKRASYPSDPKLKTTQTICNKIDKNTVTIDRTTNTATEKVKILDEVQGNKEESPVMKRADKQHRDVPQSCRNNKPTQTTENSNTLAEAVLIADQSGRRGIRRQVEIINTKINKPRVEQVQDKSNDSQSNVPNLAAIVMNTIITIISEADISKIMDSIIKITNTKKVVSSDNAQQNTDKLQEIVSVDKCNKDGPLSTRNNIPTLTTENSNTLSKTIATEEKSDRRGWKTKGDTTNTNIKVKSNKGNEKSNNHQGEPSFNKPKLKTTVSDVDKTKLAIDKTINTNSENAITDSAQKNNKNIPKITINNIPTLEKENANTSAQTNPNEISNGKDEEINVEISNKSQGDVTSYDEPKLKTTGTSIHKVDENRVSIEQSHTNTEKDKILDNSQQNKEKIPEIEVKKYPTDHRIEKKSNHEKYDRKDDTNNNKNIEMKNTAENVLEKSNDTPTVPSKGPPEIKTIITSIRDVEKNIISINTNIEEVEIQENTLQNKGRTPENEIENIPAITSDAFKTKKAGDTHYMNRRSSLNDISDDKTNKFNEKTTNTRNDNTKKETLSTKLTPMREARVVISSEDINSFKNHQTFMNNTEKAIQNTAMIDNLQAGRHILLDILKETSDTNTNTIPNKTLTQQPTFDSQMHNEKADIDNMPSEEPLVAHRQTFTPNMRPQTSNETNTDTIEMKQNTAKREIANKVIHMQPFVLINDIIRANIDKHNKEEKKPQLTTPIKEISQKDITHKINTSTEDKSKICNKNITPHAKSNKRIRIVIETFNFYPEVSASTRPEPNTTKMYTITVPKVNEKHNNETHLKKSEEATKPETTSKNNTENLAQSKHAAKEIEENPENNKSIKRPENESDDITATKLKPHVGSEIKDCKRKETNESNDKKIEANRQTSIHDNEERQFILTHVIEGFIVQESNIAFPIREPNGDRIISPNQKPQVPIEPKETNEKVEKLGEQ